MLVRGIIFILMVLLLTVACKQNKRENLMPPKVEKVKKELTVHNKTRVDNYYWLNERENPKVISYLEAENNYLKQSMEHTEDFQKKLFNEITGRIVQDEETVPYLSNGYYYYVRYEKGKEYPIYCRKKGDLTADEEVILNVNEMASGYSFYAVRGLSISPNNNLLAFGVDTVSRRKYSISVKDLSTGEIKKDIISNTTGGSVWANDNNTLFYTTKDSTLRPDKVVRYQLDKPNVNTVVYHEKDNTFNVYLSKSKSRKYIFATIESTLSSEVRVLDANSPLSEFKVIHKREKDHLYYVTHFGDAFYYLTNHNALNFKIMKSKTSQTNFKYWKEVIGHRDDVLITDLEMFKNFMVVEEQKGGLSHIRIIENKSKKEHYLPFEEPAYKAYISTNREYDTNQLRFKYTSMTTPYSTFEYNMQSKQKTLLKQNKVNGGYDKDAYITERIFAVAKDGVKIPISLVYKKDLKKAEGNPLFLYAYGSYGSSMSATFSSVRLTLLDRGFVYAIAHVRGGQEMGRQWYEDGKLLKKKNTFTDYIACAEKLIADKYAAKDKVFAYGGSAGGLLMGAVINMRPDLWRGVIAAVPFVDVVTTMLDESIPLTTGEFDEWGNPKIEKYYDYMLSYSPYDQVEKKNYPAMLVTTGLHDSQVQYWEPAKWVAKLREYKTDKNPLYLRTDMEVGHGGASGRFKRYEETALKYAFLFDLIGIEK